MRITSDSSYRSLLNDLESISERMQTAQNQISSGKKINRPSDNAAGAADVVRIGAEQDVIGQYSSNAATGQARLEFADTTLDGVGQMIDRVRSLALSSLGNISTATQYTTEISGLRDQMMSAANSTLQGQFIFAGSGTGSAAYEKQPDGSIAYQGDAEAVTLQTGRASTLQTMIPGSSVFSGSVDIFSTMTNLVNAMNAGDKNAVNAQITKLEQFSGTVSNARSQLGGLINIAKNVQTDLQQYSLARTTERSRIEDADLAQAITDFNQNQTALQAATSVGARISQISILDYLQ